MDAIRKKMQSLKTETDTLFTSIANFESVTKEANSRNDQHEADIRDLGKKIQGAEVEFDETNDKLTKALESLEEKEKNLKNAEEEVGALARRVMLMEEEAKKADSALAETVTKLAYASKEADGILKKAKHFENKTMRNEVELEKLKDKIHQLLDRLKQAEARYEYGEMNITKLNHRIDDIEDEIYREKLKIKKVSDELNDTFDDMLAHY